MLVFENKGEIDIRGITTFGVSAKKNDSAIGFFGTGLKYAIAVLLREGLKITVLRGSGEAFKFRKQPITIRNKELEVVEMIQWVLGRGDSQPVGLSFTTELGKTWELWKAYRELYCNTVDEGGTVEQVARMPRGKKGYTRVIVEGLDEVHADRGEFILDTEKLWSLDSVDIHKAGAEGGAVFYKGIRVYKPHKEAKFNYNVKVHVDLTEDRTLKNAWWAADHNIMESLLRCGEQEPILEVLTAETDTYESGWDWDGQYISATPSDVFMTVATTLKRSGFKNRNLGDYYSTAAFSHEGDFARRPLNGTEKYLLEKAVVFATPLGYKGLYGVCPTDLLQGDTMSVAKNNTIYVSTAALDGYVQDLAKLLLLGELELSKADPVEHLWGLVIGQDKLEKVEDNVPEMSHG